MAAPLGTGSPHCTLRRWTAGPAAPHPGGGRGGVRGNGSPRSSRTPSSTQNPAPSAQAPPRHFAPPRAPPPGGAWPQRGHVRDTCPERPGSRRAAAVTSRRRAPPLGLALGLRRRQPARWRRRERAVCGGLRQRCCSGPRACRPASCQPPPGSTTRRSGVARGGAGSAATGAGGGGRGGDGGCWCRTEAQLGEEWPRDCAAPGGGMAPGAGWRGRPPGVIRPRCLVTLTAQEEKELCGATAASQPGAILSAGKRPVRTGRPDCWGSARARDLGRVAVLPRTCLPLVKGVPGQRLHQGCLRRPGQGAPHRETDLLGAAAVAPEGAQSLPAEPHTGLCLFSWFVWGGAQGWVCDVQPFPWGWRRGRGGGGGGGEGGM